MGRAQILIVDDDEGVRAVLSDMLGETGHDVKAAGDALTATEEAAAGRFDIAFIDVHMPGHDGIEALQMLRKVTPATCFVMMSGVWDTALEQTCLSYGARTFLHKPLHLDEITKLVDSLTDREAELFSWERPPEEGRKPSPKAAAPAKPAAPAVAKTPTSKPTDAEVRLRDPCAVLHSAGNGEVLARFSCTVYAVLGSDCLAACDWRGVVDDFHPSSERGVETNETLSGRLVLRDAVRGPYAGPAIVRGGEIVAQGPLQCHAGLVGHGFRVSVRHAPEDSSVTLMTLEGALTKEHVPEFTDALRRATATGRSRVVVEVDRLTTMDSEAVRACIRATSQLRARNGDLRLAGATGDIWRAIEVLGAHRTIRCHATRADAVGGFGR